MPKSGSKQATIQKNKPRKKKGFRGVQKQALRANIPAIESAVNVTFVADDDVVTERIPPPEIPASARKLSIEEPQTSDSESFEGSEEARGYRLVSMKSLLMFLRRVHCHGRPCASGMFLRLYLHMY